MQTDAHRYPGADIHAWLRRKAGCQRAELRLALAGKRRTYPAEGTDNREEEWYRVSACISLASLAQQETQGFFFPGKSAGACTGGPVFREKDPDVPAGRPEKGRKEEKHKKQSSTKAEQHKSRTAQKTEQHKKQYGT